MIIKDLAKRLVHFLTRLGIPRVTPVVERCIRHDKDAFTQGLAYTDGLLYEGTGTQNHSSVRVIDPGTGAIQRMIPVPGDFCEGIALLNDKLFQLSWISGVARIYELPGINFKSKAYYPGEGWGLTAHNGVLVKSNGSSLLHFLDENFNLIRQIRVKSNGIPLWNINDIESGAGKIYANVYGSTDILEISPKNGRVRRILDCSALAVASPPGQPGAVMNGIAFNSSSRTLFVTGKYWSSIFEIRIP